MALHGSIAFDLIRLGALRIEVGDGLGDLGRHIDGHKAAGAVRGLPDIFTGGQALVGNAVGGDAVGCDGGMGGQPGGGACIALGAGPKIKTGSFGGFPGRAVAERVVFGKVGRGSSRQASEDRFEQREGFLVVGGDIDTVVPGVGQDKLIGGVVGTGEDGGEQVDRLGAVLRDAAEAATGHLGDDAHGGQVGEAGALGTVGGGLSHVRGKVGGEPELALVVCDAERADGAGLVLGGGLVEPFKRLGRVGFGARGVEIADIGLGIGVAALRHLQVPVLGLIRIVMGRTGTSIDGGELLLEIYIAVFGLGYPVVEGTVGRGGRGGGSGQEKREQNGCGACGHMFPPGAAMEINRSVWGWQGCLVVVGSSCGSATGPVRSDGAEGF